MNPANPLMPSSPSRTSSVSPPVGAPARPKDSTGNWVPIRSLGPRHRGRMAAHLLTLEERDRYLRFGYLASDAQMISYVERIDFQHDEVFGVFNRRLELIAMAHLAYPRAGVPGSEATMAEFGVSVLARARGRGMGRRLFEHAMLHARNRGVETLFIHALSENTAMLKIARNAGALVERHGSESQARLKLPPDTLSSHVGEMVEQQAAEFDYQWKRHARQVSGLLGTLSGVRSKPPEAPEPSGDD